MIELLKQAKKLVKCEQKPNRHHQNKQQKQINQLYELTQKGKEGVSKTSTFSSQQEPKKIQTQKTKLCLSKTLQKGGAKRSSS